MSPFYVDPSWYEQHWLTEHPPSGWMRLASGIAHALTLPIATPTLRAWLPSVRFDPPTPSTSHGSSAGSPRLCPTTGAR